MENSDRFLKDWFMHYEVGLIPVRMVCKILQIITNKSSLFIRPKKGMFYTNNKIRANYFKERL